MGRKSFQLFFGTICCLFALYLTYELIKIGTTNWNEVIQIAIFIGLGIMNLYQGITKHRAGNS